MTRFEIKLPDERLAALKALADRAGVSTAALAKVFIDRELDRVANPGDRTAA
jgi:hypothetical protein